MKSIFNCILISVIDLSKKEAAVDRCKYDIGGKYEAMQTVKQRNIASS